MADDAEKIIQFARNLHVSDEELVRITEEVEAKAKTSMGWGTWEERVAEVRRKVLELSLGPSPVPLAGPIGKLP